MENEENQLNQWKKLNENEFKACQTRVKETKFKQQSVQVFDLSLLNIHCYQMQTVNVVYNLCLLISLNDTYLPTDTSKKSQITHSHFIRIYFAHAHLMALNAANVAVLLITLIDKPTQN